jgi:hypothetical protein
LPRIEGDGAINGQTVGNDDAYGRDLHAYGSVSRNEQHEDAAEIGERFRVEHAGHEPAQEGPVQYNLGLRLLRCRCFDGRRAPQMGAEIDQIAPNGIAFGFGCITASRIDEAIAEIARLNAVSS